MSIAIAMDYYYAIAVITNIIKKNRIFRTSCSISQA